MRLGRVGLGSHETKGMSVACSRSRRWKHVHTLQEV